MAFDKVVYRTEKEEGLSRLVGLRLTSVNFVMDYLILGFDARAHLTVLVWPILVRGRDQICFGNSGYRDELCSYIEAAMQAATIDFDETLHFEFDDGREIRIALDAYVGPGERAILTAAKQYLLVF